MIPVKDLYDACEMMLRDKWGYIYKTAGEMWSATKQANYKKKNADDKNCEMSCKYGGKWAGHMVTDCSGVMVYIWRQHGLSIYHGSNTIRKRYCGDLVKTPHPGYAAFKVKGDDYHHIGIVAEDGLNVYEAKGTQSGFVMSAASSWHCFAPFIDVAYDETEEGDHPVIYQAVVNTNSGSLNIRKGPGTSFGIIGSMPKGEVVDVLEERDGWAHIIDGKEGWVSMQYIERIDDKQPELKEEWGVYIPCDNEEEARRYAGDIKGAVILRKEIS